MMKKSKGDNNGDSWTKNYGHNIKGKDDVFSSSALHVRWLPVLLQKIGLAKIVVMLWMISFWMGCTVKKYVHIVSSSNSSILNVCNSPSASQMLSSSESSAEQHYCNEEDHMETLSIGKMEAITLRHEKKSNINIEEKARMMQRLHHEQFKLKAEQLVHPSMMTVYEDPKHVALLIEEEHTLTNSNRHLFYSHVWNELIKYQTVEDVTFVFLSPLVSQNKERGQQHNAENLNLGQLLQRFAASTANKSGQGRTEELLSGDRPCVHVAKLLAKTNTKPGEERKAQMEGMPINEAGGEEGLARGNEANLANLNDAPRVSFVSMTSDTNTTTFDVVMWLDPYSTENLKFKPIPPASAKKSARLNKSRLYNVARYLSSKHMEEGGIMSLPLGAAPIAVRRNNPVLVQLQMDLINAIGGGAKSNENNSNVESYHPLLPNFIESHIYEEPSPSSSNSKYSSPFRDSYAIFCKNSWCRNNRALEHDGISYIQHLMKSKHLRRHTSSGEVRSSLTSFDAMSFASQARPHKVWESLYCLSSDHKEQCDFFNGYNPYIPNVYKHELEVKQSSLGPHVGRGLFTLRDIEAGSFILAEQQSNYLVFKPHMSGMIEKTHGMAEKASLSPSDKQANIADETEEEDSSDDDEEDDDDDDEEDDDIDHELLLKEFEVLDNYIESYPFADYTYGDYGWIGDAGIGMFSNHGCDPEKRHFGDLPDVFDNVVYEERILGQDTDDNANPQDELSNENLKPLFYVMSNPDGSIFNPLMDRRFGREVASEGIVKSATAGEELFCDYLSYAGVDPLEWEANAKELYEQCTNKQTGRVVQVDYKQQ